MATLTGQFKSGTYGNLIQIPNSNNGIDSTLRTMEDGKGNSLPIAISTTAISFTVSPSSPANTTSERFGLGAILSTFEESVAIGNTATVGFRASVVIGYNAFSIASEYDFNPSSFGGAPTIVGAEASGQGTSIGYQSFTGDRENIAIGPKTRAEGTGSGVGAPALIAIGDGARAIPTAASGNQIVMGDASYTKGNVNYFIGGGSGLDHDRCICFGCQGSSTAYTLSASTAAQQGFFGWFSNAGGAFPSGFIKDWWWGAQAAAEAQHTSFNITDMVGTNQAGRTWFFKASAATGNGIGGNIVFQTSTATSSGTTLQTKTTRFMIDPMGVYVLPTSNENGLYVTLSNFGNDATTGNAVLGYNVYINSSGSYVRNDTGATAIALLFNNAFGANRFSSTFITSGGTATTPQAFESTGTVNIISGGQFTFSSSATVASTAGDTGIKRVSAGIAEITDGSTGHGTLIYRDAYVAKTALYTLTPTDFTVEVTSGTHTQTLPTAVGCAGKIYVITNSGSGTVTVGTTSSQTFVNVTATPTTLTLAQFETARVQSNGANWLRI